MPRKKVDPSIWLETLLRLVFAGFCDVEKVWKMGQTWGRKRIYLASNLIHRKRP